MPTLQGSERVYGEAEFATSYGRLAEARSLLELALLALMHFKAKQMEATEKSWLLVQGVGECRRGPGEAKAPDEQAVEWIRRRMPRGERARLMQVRRRVDVPGCAARAQAGQRGKTSVQPSWGRPEGG